MARTWDLKQGLPGYDFLEIMENAFSAADLPGGIVDDAPTKVTIGDDTYKVVLKGDFVYDGGQPGPEGGTVHTIKVYAGAALVAKATGYDLDISEFDTPFHQLLNVGDFSGFLDLFFNQGVEPITIDGSNDRDVFKVPEDTAHHFYGNGGNDKFTGGEVKDKAYGGDGKDKLRGDAGNDILKGNGGKDTLRGEQGDDTLTGGKGADSFVFDFVLGNANHQAGVDRIKDFEVGKDTIVLDSAVFAAIGGNLNSSEFHVGTNAEDGDDHIIYKKGAGKLFYDDNGDAAGGRTLFATFDGKPNLSHNDFDII